MDWECYRVSKANTSTRKTIAQYLLDEHGEAPICLCYTNGSVGGILVDTVTDSDCNNVAHKN